MVSARLSSDQFPVPAPRSGSGLFIMNGLASKPDHVRLIRINGRSEDMKENRPFNRNYEVLVPTFHDVTTEVVRFIKEPDLWTSFTAVLRSLRVFC